MEAHIFRLPVAARPPTNNAARRKAGLRVCLFFIRGANASKAHHKSKSFPGLKKQAIRRQPLTGSRYNSRLFKKAEKKARLQARHKQLSGNRRGSTLSPLPSAGAGQKKNIRSAPCSCSSGGVLDRGDADACDACHNGGVAGAAAAPGSVAHRGGSHDVEEAAAVVRDVRHESTTLLQPRCRYRKQQPREAVA